MSIYVGNKRYAPYIGDKRRRYIGGTENYPPNAIMTKRTNPEVLAVCYAQGWCANPNYMTDTEAAAVTDVGTVFRSNTSITSFDEFQYFTGVSSLANYAFQSCSNLKSIVFPPNLTISGSYAFRYCSNLEYVVLTSGFKMVTNGYAFQNCTKLKKIKWNTTQAFDYGLLNTLYLEEIESDVYDVYDKCIYDGNKLVFCPNNHVITFKPGVTELGDYCFCRLQSMTSIVIPSGVTTIGSSFMNYSTIQEIDFPATVTTIKTASMQRATAMIHCKVRATTPPTLANYSTNYITAGTEENPRYLHVPVGATAYETSAWKTQFVTNKGWTLVYDL